MADPHALEPRVSHHRVAAADGVSIAYTWFRAGSGSLMILAPGFWRVRLARENLFLAIHYLRRGYDVAAIDFRGHGESEGRYTFGAAEAQDFLAVVGELSGPDRPYDHFSVLGLSMGGSIAAHALAERPDLPARALAMVSSPADFFALRPKPWKPGALRQVRLRHALRPPRVEARTVLKSKPRATDSVSRVSVPKLIVTSEDDWLVHPTHGRWLADAAASPVDYVHLDTPGSLHADGLVKFAPLRLLRALDPWFARHAPPQAGSPLSAA
jgi:pimeloyl-ACP methyl ester carboxylesterase